MAEKPATGVLYDLALKDRASWLHLDRHDSGAAAWLAEDSRLGELVQCPRTWSLCAYGSRKTASSRAG